MLKHLKVHIFLGKAFELIYVIHEHFSAMKKSLKMLPLKQKLIRIKVYSTYKFTKAIF